VSGQAVDVVVTGGAGFIGTNLVMRLSAHPDVASVTIFDNFSTAHRVEHDSPKVRIVEGDLRDADAVLACLDGASRVIHLGALGSVPRSILDPRTSHDVNVTGTFNVLEAARQVGIEHVISASSSSVYGANPTLPKSEDLATYPLSPYAVTKLATEAYTNAYETAFGLPTLAFRFFNVFGPYQRADHAYAAVIPRFVSAILRGEPVTVFGDGTQSRDFTSVHSVTDALTKAMLGKITSPIPVNLAFGTRVTLLQLIETLEAIHGSPVEITMESPRPGDVPHSQAEHTNLDRLVGPVFRPELRDALAEVYAFLARPSDG
jgi:UDP-glucose 4-epimerase